ncbi:hypothetical protein Clacol_002155 [Clathrus columnatus]|uniref:Uncharacterized protein n=1 Tax=Clathrus columnatus TaxID=1419009 RepID=A0AAV5A5L7_9AGAM|nr:hypothetical protein Clacol_002155 [Clathrus columnatus]
MAPRELRAHEQALVNKWVPWMFYFMKMMRRANRYLVPIPQEKYTAAYKEVCNSGFVAGGEWGKRDPNDKSYWEPKPKDRDAYVKYMKDVIERHPITSAYNAVVVFFAGNGGSTCVDNIVCMFNSPPAQRTFWREVHRLNNADLEEVMNNEALMERNNPRPNDIPPRDPNERPINMPFIRPRTMHSDIKISANNWGQYEKIGQTFFVEDDDEAGGYAVFELAGVLLLETGKFYKIRYEHNVDSIQITERELFTMIRDGIWV